MSDTPIASELNSALGKLVVATIVLYLVVLGVVVYVWHDANAKRADIARIALSTNTSLCTVRQDLERRVSDSRHFLAEHPNGIAGIPPATIRQSIRNEEGTVHALSSLRCTTPAPTP